MEVDEVMWQKMSVWSWQKGWLFSLTRDTHWCEGAAQLRCVGFDGARCGDQHSVGLVL